MKEGTTPYPANKGEIASPATDSVVDSLKEGSKNSLPVNHNVHHFSFDKGASEIETPATDSIVKNKI